MVHALNLDILVEVYVFLIAIDKVSLYPIVQMNFGRAIIIENHT
jgi:hypothetical protein